MYKKNDEIHEGKYKMNYNQNTEEKKNIPFVGQKI